jgi:hypothetical protein
MRRELGSPSGRHAWLIARVVALLLIATTGVVAIVHYSSFGAALATAHEATTTARRTDAVTLPPARHRAPKRPTVAAPPPGAAAAKASNGSAHAASGPDERSGPPPGSAPPAGAPPPPGAPPPGSGPPGSGPAGAGPPMLGTGAPLHFRTLPPRAKLPTGAQCARWVRASPSPENKSVNKKDNHITGQHVGARFFSGDAAAAARLARRINGDFTGTTAEILRWAACKWGISQNIVFAQAAVESWWRQTTLGDWGTDAKACPPGHGLGADDKAGECPQSYGILQNRYPYEQASWPGIGRSTAMNADAAYATWRSCYDGYETWLNTVPRGSQYHAGDVWGCVGRWFAGRWRTAAADGYIKRVKQYLRERIWEKPYFRQIG